MVDTVALSSTANPDCHVVAMPYPGRGHINPLMNLCKLLTSRNQNILITVIVTEEWLSLIASEPKPDSLRFATIPNILPSEHTRFLDFPGFYEAVMTKLESPFEELLHRLHPPVNAIISDLELLWAIELGNRRNIPVATLCTMSATVFSAFYHFQPFAHCLTSPIKGLESDNHPGISSPNLAELRANFLTNDLRTRQLLLECISKVQKAESLLFTSVHELEDKELDTLKANLPIPVYSIGPAIPYFELEAKDSHRIPDYQKWLDSQPEASVLYISLGSSFSVSTTQMDEIVGGIQDSGVRYLLIARREISRIKEMCKGDKGLVLHWCHQLKVLCHSAIGGFWTHCGWNSTLEAAYAGVPMLTFPLALDQYSNSKQILEKWRIGKKVQRQIGEESFVTREDISQLIQKCMDVESSERKEIKQRAKAVRGVCRQAITEGGSSFTNLDALIMNLLQGNRH